MGPTQLLYQAGDNMCPKSPLPGPHLATLWGAADQAPLHPARVGKTHQQRQVSISCPIAPM